MVQHADSGFKRAHLALTINIVSARVFVTLGLHSGPEGTAIGGR